jgi:hypothetical protein
MQLLCAMFDVTNLTRLNRRLAASGRLRPVGCFKSTPQTSYSKPVERRHVVAIFTANIKNA